jgi:hypothetical protein
MFIVVLMSDFLLYGNGRAHSVSAPKGVRPEMPDFRGFRCPPKFSPHARVGVLEPAEFDGSCENPVFSARKIGPPFPGL